jgi:hypothetical protein
MRLLFLALLAPVLAWAGPIAAQQPVDAVALAEAKVLMEKAGMGALTQQVARATMQQQRAALEKANPGRSNEIAEIMKLMESELAKRLPRIMEAYARIYTLHFTLAELRELNRFYDTPIGRKLVKETPAISAEAMAMSQAFGQEIVGEVMRAVAPELEKRRLNGPSRI